MLSVRKMLPNSMSDRPGYTSGRGATITDLDSEKLLYIHDNIKKNISKEAAENMIQMVKNLKVASCTGFLNELYSLERNNWIYVEKENGSERNDIHCENEGEAFGTMMGMFGGNNSDDTLQIVTPFLRNFNEKHITNVGRVYNKLGYYYEYN